MQPHPEPDRFQRVTGRTAFGPAAITQALTDLTYPCGKADVLAKLPHGLKIAWTMDQQVPARALCEALPDERFEDEKSLALALHEAGFRLGVGDGGRKPKGAEP